MEKLKAEANRPYRLARVRETNEDGYYVRHALFPRVVKEVYQNTCCVCGLNVSLPKGRTLIDAAHIIPFAVSHDDDLSNGLALCKNHHWGFDGGWFGVSDAYKIIVSPRLQNGLTYVTNGTPLRLPAKKGHYPSADALAWHRDNCLQG